MRLKKRFSDRDYCAFRNLTAAWKSTGGSEWHYYFDGRRLFAAEEKEKEDSVYGDCKTPSTCWLGRQ